MKARYAQDPNLSVVLDVVKTHPDKTVDLANADGVTVVTKCPVADELKVGQATLIPDEKPAPAPKK